MTQHLRVAIIGTGFSGLGAAIRLLDQGRTDFLVFERATEVGGVWRENTYPGCACDVESHLYSFSFAPNPSWSHSYSPQAEIQRYLLDCVERFGVRPFIRFEHTVHATRWDDREQHWVIETSRGIFTADAVIAAGGALSEPSLPRIDGLERFGGPSFHSAKWDHSVELRGKRVGVVGTGASAAQFIPALQPHVAKLTVFQRTPAWVVPRNDRAFSEETKRLFARRPLLHKLMRASIYARRELFGTMFLRRDAGKLLEPLVRLYLRRQVADPTLREKLTPRYRMGCKRVIVSDDYYPALTQANVAVETTTIREVTEAGVVTADGREHPLDVLILGTGFAVTEMPLAKHVHGRAGRTLHEAWNGSMRAHAGTTFPGFPNFFMIPGPNTGLGHSSMILMIEAQVEHVLDALAHLDRTGAAALEPSVRAEARYVSEVDEGLSNTVWATGCQSWYLDATGRNSTLWPSYTFDFMRSASRFNRADYVLEERRNASVRLPFKSRLEGLVGGVLSRLPERLLAPRPLIRGGLTLEPELQAILAIREVTGSLPLSGVSVVESRARLRRDTATAAGAPIRVAGVGDLTLDFAGLGAPFERVPHLRARHYRPRSEEGAPLVVYFHGGGFVLGDLETHDAPCRLLCRDGGVHVLSVDYRLAPEHPHPAAVFDATAAYAWAVAHAASLGADPRRIAVAGDSAGGNLAAVVTQEARRLRLERPALQVLIYPAIDRTKAFPSKRIYGEGFMLESADMDWFARKYRADRYGVPDVTADPGLERNLSGLARALVITAGFDPLRDEGEDYAHRLEKAGVLVTLRREPGLIHGFLHMLAVSSAARRATEDLAADVGRLLMTVERRQARSPSRRPSPEGP